jgi:cbb3-type cytochrome oxidase maturation protein
MLSLGTWVVLGWILLVALIGIGFLIWGWRNAQFKDIESAKYKMLEDKEPQPWPGREKDKNEHS